MYDVIVVGARAAGAPLAMLLARRGFRVLAVDRARFPSDTISTHYIHQAGLARLRDWDLLDTLVATGCPPVRHLNFTYTDITLAGFADPISGIDAVYCPRRTVLDEILVDAARRSGAEVMEGFTVTDLLEENDSVAGIRGRDGDGRSVEFRAPLVIGADGAGSTVAKLVGAQMYKHAPAGCFIFYSYYSGLDWGMQHRTGFGEQQFGSWPTNDGLSLVAVMRRRDRFRDFRADPDAGVQEIVDAVDPVYGEQLRENGERAEPFRPMLYPDNYFRRSHGPGWALVGDAGYHKDPFTGLGITDAFKNAELLADRITEGFGGARPMAEALESYELERDAASVHSFDFTVAISDLSLTPYHDSVFRAASHSPRYTKKFFGHIGGGISAEEFFDPEALAELYREVDLPEADRHLVPA
ncbi:MULTISPECIES: NAD(P)/FAD-dependent oxidoreductase [unclassified Gordonia (in: high G+C Gram-positive bacteria)]|uniref:NAD(P)/FAD-dependent oxidoreductase n=1 Tax=unclassified Gordonia (in: high G+C Gram-positive bacteria) TaxID=2657482 RepID=UPI0009AF08BC|nr:MULTISPECIES: NAD(P)/FAD-dependent oxidoreductase [unclassified Gordonia (in: high G+C Gram-positive bacteria)]MDF3284427.1 NAD(P)/FAD-dependent oxidoreductase [Gordonia sp. N1V]OPX16577.1 FAD-binding monooxygenase [Gordonia sp. i37]